jgi:hypothetical protein
MTAMALPGHAAYRLRSGWPFARRRSLARIVSGVLW